MKKRVISLVLSGIVFSSVLLSGCSSGTGDQESQRAQESQAGTENHTEEAGGESEAVEFEEVTLKMSTIGTETNSDTMAAKKMAEEILEETGGKIKIEVYPTDQLAGGDMAKSVELLSMGTIDLMTTSVGTLSSTVDERMQISCLPWTFDSYEQANEVISASGADYWKSLLEAKGIRYLNYTHNGLRQLTNSKHPIKTLDDIKGMKIRIPGGAVYMSVFQELGADPISMNWSEVFTALQQGTIDGQENGLTVTNSNNLFEVQKYLTIWNYMYECNLWIANDETFSKLQPETQEYLQKKLDEACQYGREIVETGEEDLKKLFAEKGMEIYELNADEIKAFRDAVQPVIDEYKEKYGEEACDAFAIE